MQDLNDLYYFVQVVNHGGFAPAGRALGVPKSKLSRRLAVLEDRLDTRLVNRSTRRFTVTELGQDYYRHCVAMLTEAEAAQEVIDQARAEPRGVVKLSCPPGLIYFHVGQLLVRFMAEYPEVKVEIDATSRRVDVLKEGLDLALRIRFPPLEDSGLTMKVLSKSPQCLMASRDFFDHRAKPESPADLANLPSLDFEQPDGKHVWCLDGPDSAVAQVHHSPRLVTDDVFTLRQAALEGLGVVRMPLIVGGRDLVEGRLINVLPGWQPRGGILHAVFPSRRGLLPAVRALLDYLANSMDEVDFSMLEPV
ncbi:LysR substrate-binding domain-containing protein [Marinobacter goseongensis]|uniref:LysR substrate-binding domain-containing protein n=1 Tax=Marinobacter goseongensis TaxID=453838 RepID=UPI002003D0FE|nr:LysR substrate-binding domain-containing protein [Marinobacter goseongensis]MCK7551696.1 LysR substrate-binding domain-containing protein [Marinobacter goseongensis]